MLLKSAAFLAATVALGGLFGLGRIERAMVYPFDATRVDPADLGLALREEVFASGGSRLVVWVAAPAPGKPAVLYFHGNAGNLAARAGRFRLLLERGYGLIAPAYRGSSGSTGTPGEAALTRDATRLYLHAGDFVGTAPLVIYGESLGTGVAVAVMASAAADPVKGIGPPAALVLEAPFTSLPDVAVAGDSRLAPLAARMKNRWDSLSRAGALTGPLLVLHGSADEVVPIGLGRQLFAAAPSRDKRFLDVAGGHHTDLWRPEVLTRLWRFLDTATK